VSRTLVIGNRNYSSWSLRPWLALRHAGLAFSEIRIALSQPDTPLNIARHSPSGRVPCLIDGALTIWDSLAICEYAAEQVEPGLLWPREKAARARARAVTAEMHSGFAALRSHMPMDIRSHHPAKGAAAQQRADVATDIERIRAIWSDCLATSGGPWLFGDFSIADAFYAPVVTRFATYQVPLADGLAAYSDQMLGLPLLREWSELARAEIETIDY
jgi:glutathione S-transferase